MNTSSSSNISSGGGGRHGGHGGHGGSGASISYKRSGADLNDDDSDDSDRDSDSDPDESDDEMLDSLGRDSPSVRRKPLNQSVNSPAPTVTSQSSTSSTSHVMMNTSSSSSLSSDAKKINAKTTTTVKTTASSPREEFERYYGEYEKLRSYMEGVRLHFAELNAQIHQEEEGTDEWNVSITRAKLISGEQQFDSSSSVDYVVHIQRMADRFMREYEDLKKSTKYRDAKQRYKYLHDKLSSLREAVLQQEEDQAEEDLMECGGGGDARMKSEKSSSTSYAEEQQRQSMQHEIR